MGPRCVRGNEIKSGRRDNVIAKGRIGNNTIIRPPPLVLAGGPDGHEGAGGRGRQEGQGAGGCA